MSEVLAGKRQSRRGLPAAVAAGVLGVAYGLLNLSWAAGSEGLKNVYGSHLVGAAWADDTQFRIASLVLGLVFLAVAVLGVRAVQLDWDAPSRPAWRWTAWSAAGLLALYGAGLTVIGLYVQITGGTGDSATDQDLYRWHAFLWDPWFLVWGLLLVTALLRSARAYLDSGRVLIR